LLFLYRVQNAIHSSHFLHRLPLSINAYSAQIQNSKTSALAALAVVSAASAQSSLTIDGYIDRGFATTNNTNNTKDAKAVGSNAGTTTVGIKGSEDLGGGFKAGFSINTDWNEAAGQTQDALAQTDVPAGSSGFGNSQSFLELSSATYGSLRLGSPNNEILGATTSVASPAFSTGIGSAYSSSFSVTNGYGTGTVGAGNIINAQATITGTANAGQRGIRQANTIKYISPNISGFSAALGVVQKNSTAGTADIVGVTDMSVSYANGPVQVVYAAIQYKVGANVPLNGSLAANGESKSSILGASYQVLPNVKLHAGLSKSTSTNTAVNYDSTGTQFGVTYDVTPVIVVMAQMAKVNDKAASNVDRKMVGLGADYKFSKTTRAYVRYDSIDYKSNGTAESGSEVKRTAFGVSKAF
jgi:predicted porin